MSTEHKALAEDLAPWLRDWQLQGCGHRTRYRNDPYCCAPCLRNRFLASDWLAAHDRRVRAEALRAAQVVLAGEDTVEWARTATSSMLSLSYAIGLLDDAIGEADHA